MFGHLSDLLLLRSHGCGALPFACTERLDDAVDADHAPAALKNEDGQIPLLCERKEQKNSTNEIDCVKAKFRGLPALKRHHGIAKQEQDRGNEAKNLDQLVHLGDPRAQDFKWLATRRARAQAKADGGQRGN